MPSTTGARGVEVQEYLCRIREISCKYEVRGKKKAGILYRGDGRLRKEENTNINDLDDKNAPLKVSVTNDYGRYFVISNNDGVELELNCDKNANLCDDDSHKMVDIYAPDFTDNSTKKERRKITEKKLKVYYYNIFRRTGEWRKASPVYLKPASMLAGNFVDLLASLRYIGLPELKTYDDECFYDLQYQDCISNPNILLQVYPDIKFSIVIGYKGYSRSLNKGGNPSSTATSCPTDDKDVYTRKDFKAKEITKSDEFNFHFDVKYGVSKKEFDFKSFTSLEKEAKDNLLYKTLQYIGRAFYNAGNYAEALSHDLADGANASSSLAAGELAIVGVADKGIGKTLVKSRRWLSGSLSVKPQLSAKWSYDTSEDLRQLLRHIILTLKAECTGELKIDLVEIFFSGIRKARKLTTAAALVVSVGSLGIGSLLAAVCKLIIDAVLTWLLNKLKDGVKFNLVLIGKVELEGLSFDSLREEKMEALKVIINPEIRLELGVDVKASISFIGFKATGAGGGSVESSTSLEWVLKLNCRENNLGIDQDMSIKPFKIKVTAYILGSCEISLWDKDPQKDGVKETEALTKDENSISWNSKSEWSKEWSVKEIKRHDLDRWVLFDYGNKSEGESIDDEITYADEEQTAVKS